MGIYTGEIARIEDPVEAAFAKEALFSRHPQMSTWPADHGWYFARLNIENIYVLDFFGGIKTPTWTSITVQLFNLNISLSLNMKIKKDIGLKLCDNNTSHNVFLINTLFGIIQYNQNQIKKKNLMIF